MDSAGMQREMQSVGMAMTATIRTALQTDVTVFMTEHPEALALEQNTRHSRRGVRDGGRQLRLHFEQRPPRQRGTGYRKRGGREWRFVQVVIEQFQHGRIGLPIQSVQPAAQVLGLRFTQSYNPDFPQLEIGGLGERNAEACVLAGGEGGGGRSAPS